MIKNFFISFSLILFVISCSSPDSIIVNEISKEEFIKDFTKTNTIYEIYDDVDFENDDFIIPDNCTLRFISGKISHANIIFNNTILEGNISFYDCTYNGHIANDEIQLKWFQQPQKSISVCMNDDKKEYKKAQPLTKKFFESIIKCCQGKTIIVDDFYTFKQTIIISNKITFKSLNLNESVYAINYYNIEYGFHFPDEINGFVINNGGDLSLLGISIIGTYGLYISGNLWDNYGPDWYPDDTPPKIFTTGIEVKKGGNISEIYNSTINTFTYGIKLNPESNCGIIKNTYLSSCRFGLYADSVSNLKFTGCRFNTNLINFPFHYRSINNNRQGINENEGNQLRKMGSGVYLRNCTDSIFENNRFEFNNIHLIIDECGTNLTVKNNIFDTGSACHVLIYNANDSENVINNSFSQSNPAMNNIFFINNTMARGSRHDYTNSSGKAVSHPGFGIFHITEGNNRGAKVYITNNIVSDDMEMESREVTYQNQVFCIYNTSTSATDYFIEGNSFAATKAKYLYYGVSDSQGIFTIHQKGNSTGNLIEKGGKTEIIKISE